MAPPLQEVSLALQQEEEGNPRICHWTKGGVGHIDRSLETPEEDSRESMQLGRQSRSSQSETHNAEVGEEGHAFCIRLCRSCVPGAEGNHDILVGET